MWRNDMKCEYMFMFPLQNLAGKEFDVYFVLPWTGMNKQSSFRRIDTPLLQ